MDYSGIEIDNLNFAEEEILRIFDDAIGPGDGLIAGGITCERESTCVCPSKTTKFACSYYNDKGEGFWCICSWPDDDTDDYSAK